LRRRAALLPGPDAVRPRSRRKAAPEDPVRADSIRDDAVAARYEDERLIEIVSARPEGRAFQVDAAGEPELPVRVLD
jgi:hypothetical protein